MPSLSRALHGMAYSTPDDLSSRFNDIRLLLQTVVALPIDKQIKKRVLNQILWEPAYVTGNAQGAFLGRYRSQAVVEQPGLKIQRDHVYGRKALLEELFTDAPDFERIVHRATCCVVLTEAEHRRLGRGENGGGKYVQAGVPVFDMLDKTLVDPRVLWPL